MSLFNLFKKVAVGVATLLFTATVYAQIAAPTSFAGITFGADISTVTGQTLTEISVPNNKSGLKFYSTTGGASAPNNTTLSNVVLIFKNGKFQGGRGTAVVTSGTWATIQTASEAVYGPVAPQSITGITRSGNVATATKTAHGYTTGDYVTIAGADQADYNIGATVTVPDANTFTYTVANNPVTPATGTITASESVGPFKNTTIQHSTRKSWRHVVSNVTTEIILQWNSTNTTLTYSVRRY